MNDKADIKMLFPAKRIGRCISEPRFISNDKIHTIEEFSHRWPIYGVLGSDLKSLPQLEAVKRNIMAALFKGTHNSSPFIWDSILFKKEKKKRRGEH